MSLNFHSPVPDVARSSQFGLLLRRACIRLPGIARKSTLLLVEFTLALYFVFCLLFLLLRYLVMPNIDYYKGDVEQLATRALGQKVTISAIAASWQGLRPSLSLTNVVLHDPRGSAALTLPVVDATLSWWSIPAAELRLYRLQLDRPDLNIQRDSKGNIEVGGMLVQTDTSGGGKGADWVLAQREIVIRNGILRWNDQQRNAPELVLHDVSLTLQNSWHHHQVALKAVPPPTLAAPLDLRAAFDHPAFSSHPSDPRRWTGEVYADLRDTDLAGWKSYMDYAFEVRHGTGSVRAWLNVDHARVANFTADLNVVNIATRLRSDLQPLNLRSASGRLSMREVLAVNGIEGKPTFGANGYSVSMTNFSMESEDGVRLPATTLTQSFTPATRKAPEKFSISANSLDLEVLAGLVERLPVPIASRKLLQDMGPHGQLREFAANWEGSYPEISAYHVKGQFLGLSLAAQPARAARPKTATMPAQAAVPAIPGFTNLTGAIDASDRGGAIDLASRQLKLQLPGYLPVPEMPFEQLAMRASWSFQKNDQILLQVNELNIVQEGVHASLTGRHLMPLQPGGGHLGEIDVTAKITSVDLNRLDRYLPVQTPTPLRNWLVGALKQGQAQDVVVRLKGDLAQFPFHVQKPGEPPRGVFTVNAKLVNGSLDYAPHLAGKDGKGPLWPLAEKINGSLTIDRTRLDIRADTAVTQDVILSKVIATIPDFMASDMQLSVEGDANGALQDLVRYINASPVFDWTGRFTEETRATGQAKLSLKLQLPLDHVVDTKVAGVLQFLNDDVTLQSAIPMLSQTSGKLEFNEKGFNLSSLKANFIGAAATLTGGTQKDGTILVKADGGVSADGLRKTYPSVPMQRVLQKISGATRYNVSIAVRKRLVDVVVESNLQGIGLDLPAPLRKASTEVLPFRFEQLSLASTDPAQLRDDIKLSLGSAFSARYLRGKPADKNVPWRVLRGGIGINAPPPEPDSGLNINVNLRALNVDAWRSLVSSVAGNDKAREAAATRADDGPDLAQYVEPDVMAARATELIISGKKLDNVVVGVSRQKDIWQANIDATQVSGYLTWAEPSAGRGYGKVTARLTSLTIPPSSKAEVSELLEAKNTATQIPALDIVADNFQLLGKNFGRVELVANNAAVSGGSEWRISKLSIANQDAELKASGKFTSKDGASISNLVYTLDIADAGRLLERFGFANVLRGGRGKMEGDLTWNGVPFSLDIPSLSGQIQLDLAAGQFLKVDTGAAKLLGVLSLQSLPRRLTLDFRDVFSEGFAFDGITANAAITKGVARTSNFKMRSVSAAVLMDGSVDIAAETQALHVVVLPEINVGAASVVYALAINPVIGLGSFLAQLFLREPLMRAFTFEYAISGPWKDPTVRKIDRTTGLPVAPKAPASEINHADKAG